jgi:hypothetical protein
MMMQHMMEHMAHGEGMPGCPMMQKMPGMHDDQDEEPTDPHHQH